MAGEPQLPKRDYSSVVVALRGDEALAFRTATDALIAKLAAEKIGRSVLQYYGSISTRGEQWVVQWSLNDGDARGGGIEMILDKTGTKVLTTRFVE